MTEGEMEAFVKGFVFGGILWTGITCVVWAILG